MSSVILLVDVILFSVYGKYQEAENLMLAMAGTIKHYNQRIAFASGRVEMLQSKSVYFMMTWSNENIFCVTGPLWGEFTGDRWIPLTKVSDAELWCFLWSAPEQTVE